MSSSLSRADVLRIAELARLELTSEEVELFTPQLARILDYVEQIHALDTSGVPPTSHATSQPVERDDAPGRSLPRDRALANAPDPAPASGFFKVPRVMG